MAARCARVQMKTASHSELAPAFRAEEYARGPRQRFLAPLLNLLTVNCSLKSHSFWADRVTLCPPLALLFFGPGDAR